MRGRRCSERRHNHVQRAKALRIAHSVLTIRCSSSKQCGGQDEDRGCRTVEWVGWSYLDALSPHDYWPTTSILTCLADLGIWCCSADPWGERLDHCWIPTVLVPEATALTPEVNVSTVAGSSSGSSVLVLGPSDLLDSGTDLVEVGLVMRDLRCRSARCSNLCWSLAQLHYCPLVRLLLWHLVRNVNSINEHRSKVEILKESKWSISEYRYCGVT